MEAKLEHHGLVRLLENGFKILMVWLINILATIIESSCLSYLVLEKMKGGTCKKFNFFDSTCTRYEFGLTLY